MSLEAIVKKILSVLTESLTSICVDVLTGKCREDFQPGFWRNLDTKNPRFALLQIKAFHFQSFQTANDSKIKMDTF